MSPWRSPSPTCGAPRFTSRVRPDPRCGISVCPLGVPHACPPTIPISKRRTSLASLLFLPSRGVYAIVFNPAAHSWIIVPADEQNTAHQHAVLPNDSDLRQGPAELRYHVENRVLADIGALAVPVSVAAAIPSPAVSEVADLLEGSLAAHDAAPAEQELPDGVPAWTQADMHIVKEDGTSLSVEPARKVSAWRELCRSAPLLLGCL